MTGVEGEAPAVEEPVEREDRTGRDRLVRNILSGWGGQVVFVVAGFVMPRLIDRSLGQTSLGIWDFGWSIVSYFGLAQIGIGTAVSRHVAQERAMNDEDGLRRTVSTGMAFHVAIGVFLLLVTAALAWFVPQLLGGRLGGHTQETRWVVALLGATVATQVGCDNFHGILTGCHRWDLHNAISSGTYAAIVAGMLLTLSLGGGLPGLALTNLLGAAAGETARGIAAYRVCPEARFGWRFVSRGELRRLVRFGGKAVVNGLAHLLLRKGNSLVVAAYLGPDALAVYSRPDALIRTADMVLTRFSYVFAPVASSLQVAQDHEELRRLMIQSSRYAASLALPMVVGLVALGDPILQLWMGARYDRGIVLVVMALGSLMSLSQHPVTTMLVGMNLHGRPAYFALASAVVGLGLSLFGAGYLGWGLAGAAVALAIPNTIGNGFVVAWYACRKLEIPYGRYLAHAWAVPLACNLPFAACLVAVRLGFANRPLVAVLLAFATGLFVLAPLYWRYLTPPDVQEAIRQRVRSLPARLGLGRGGVRAE
jgi:O-antigen/teichoic acid export membrane protein